MYEKPEDRFLAKRNRRRTRKLQAPYEAFTREEIFARDGWTCGICHEAVDPGLAYPEPMSASIDHILPLAKGGSHTRANAQCAHWLCNSRKSDSVEAEPLAA